MANMIRVVKVEPGKPAREARIENILTAMQHEVGGYIGVLTIMEPGQARAAIVHNDEGKLMGLPMNRAIAASGKEDTVDDIIAGPFFICGVDPNTFDFIGLTDEQVAHYLERFKTPERFSFDPKRNELTVFRGDTAKVYGLGR